MGSEHDAVGSGCPSEREHTTLLPSLLSELRMGDRSPGEGATDGPIDGKPRMPRPRHSHDAKEGLEPGHGRRGGTERSAPSALPLLRHGAPLAAETVWARPALSDSVAPLSEGTTPCVELVERRTSFRTWLGVRVRVGIRLKV